LNTNNKIVEDDYSYFLGNVWMNGYRAKRLAELIEGKDKISVDDCQSMQVDVFCLPGLEFVRRISDLEGSNHMERYALEHLRAWDGHLTSSCVGGSIYEVFRYTLLCNLLRPILGEELMFRVMGVGFHPVLKPVNEFYGHDTSTLFRMMDDPNSWWMDAAGGRKEVLERSLRESVAWLSQEIGTAIDEWQWGKLHRIAFPHAMGLQKPLDQVFNRGPIPIGGDTDTLCQTAMLATQPYDNLLASASFRQVVDLGELSKSVIIVPGGQSGTLASPHYDDLIAPWTKGELLPMLWTRNQVEENAEGRLIIQPNEKLETH
jgi:penicillin amidase